MANANRRGTHTERRKRESSHYYPHCFDQIHTQIASVASYQFSLSVSPSLLLSLSLFVASQFLSLPFVSLSPSHTKRVLLSRARHCSFSRTASILSHFVSHVVSLPLCQPCCFSLTLQQSEALFLLTAAAGLSNVHRRVAILTQSHSHREPLGKLPSVQQ